MAKSLRAKTANTFVFVLIGLLILGLAGFGNGSFTSSASAVGNVGNREITVDDYYQQLQREIDAFARSSGQQVSASEAIQLGLGQSALEKLVLRAAIDNEAQLVGISIGDQSILDELTSMSQFSGPDGGFSRDAYDFTLERTGQTAAQFDQTIRDNQTRRLIETAVGDGIASSDAAINQMLDYYLSKRSITWAAISEELLDGDLPDPNDQDLLDYHADNEADYTLPESRQIAVAWITPEKLADSSAVDEARARELYDERQDEYSKPERRDVDRLVFPDLEAAAAAKRRLDAEEIDFDGLVDELEIQISDISLGSIESDAIAAPAAEAVFASETTDVIGPVDSSLGPALFRINAILGAQFTAFEDVQNDLATELATQDAASLITNSITSLEDLVASGASIEDIAAESDLEQETIQFDENSSSGIARYEEFTAAANSGQIGDFLELRELSGGGLFVLRVDEITPPVLQPLDDVRESVETNWRQQQLSQRLQEKAEELAAEIASDASFEDVGLTPTDESELARNGFVSGAPSEIGDKAFALNIGEVTAFGSATNWGVLRVNSETPPDPDAEDIAGTVDGLNSQFIAGIGRDAVALYSNYLRQQVGLRLQVEVIDAIHAQLP